MFNLATCIVVAMARLQWSQERVIEAQDRVTHNAQKRFLACLGDNVTRDEMRQLDELHKAYKSHVSYWLRSTEEDMQALDRLIDMMPVYA